jgi:hypothetical protein
MSQNNQDKPPSGFIRNRNRFMLEDPNAIKKLTEEEKLNDLAEELEAQMDQEMEQEGYGFLPTKKYNKLSTLYKRVGTKAVLGKNKVIYKMKGSNKEYVRSKGKYVHISEYKKSK